MRTGGRTHGTPRSGSSACAGLGPCRGRDRRCRVNAPLLRPAGASNRRFPGAFAAGRPLRPCVRSSLRPAGPAPAARWRCTMARERLYLFDTTLRDGAQTNGVDFTLADKLVVAKMLDALGVDYIEAGYPGANPTDTQFFAEPRGFA